jgi:very long chain acyl-CoA dehydrogenase
VKAGFRDLGLYGLQVPESLGGVGLSNAPYARMVEVVGRHDLGVGIHLGSHQSIGYKGILVYGNEAQKQKYLPKLASGEQIAAFALTEPGAGSDAQGIKTRAVLSADGKTWVLNGAKIWISNGGFADVLTVFAKTEVKDPVTGEKKDRMTAFIVERAFGGVTAGPPEDKMGIKCSNTCEVYFENVPIPAENVIGEVGAGFKICMGILNNGRFGMGAALTGTMKKMLAGVTEHLKQRKQFGKALSDFGAVKGMIATMNARCYAAESMAYLLAANMDRGAQDYAVEAAISKVFASEAAWYVTNEALQLMGGLGFMRSLPYERTLRDLKIFSIFEGANGTLRQMIGLQGFQNVGKDLEPLQKAIKNPFSNPMAVIDFALTEAKARAGMLDKPSCGWAPAELKSVAAVLENNVGLFGYSARGALIKHGKKIIDAQLVVEKAADVVIDLTAVAAVLSRATKALAEKAPTAAHEVAMAKLFAADADKRIKLNIRAVGGDSSLNKLKYEVADQAFAHGGYFATHPMGI